MEQSPGTQLRAAHRLADLAVGHLLVASHGQDRPLAGLQLRDRPDPVLGSSAYGKGGRRPWMLREFRPEDTTFSVACQDPDLEWIPPGPVGS